jgi:hypothetical protein
MLETEVKKGKKEYCAEWYVKNKQAHLEYVGEKIKCTCGKPISRGNMAKHIKTSAHRLHSTNKIHELEQMLDILNKRLDVLLPPLEKR